MTIVWYITRSTTSVHRPTISVRLPWLGLCRYIKSREELAFRYIHAPGPPTPRISMKAERINAATRFSAMAEKRNVHSSQATNCCLSYSRRKRQHWCPKRQQSCRKRQQSCRKRRLDFVALCCRFRQQFVSVFGNFVARCGQAIRVLRLHGRMRKRAASRPRTLSAVTDLVIHARYKAVVVTWYDTVVA